VTLREEEGEEAQHAEQSAVVAHDVDHHRGAHEKHRQPRQRLAPACALPAGDQDEQRGRNCLEHDARADGDATYRQAGEQVRCPFEKRVEREEVRVLLEGAVRVPRIAVERDVAIPGGVPPHEDAPEAGVGRKKDRDDEQADAARDEAQRDGGEEKLAGLRAGTRSGTDAPGKSCPHRFLSGRSRLRRRREHQGESKSIGTGSGEGHGEQELASSTT